MAALTRIFKLCDVNKDGLLDDDELNDFQRLCFDAPLQARELEGVKEVVAQSTATSFGDEPGIVDGCLTEHGFLFLHTYFIQKGRLETTWKALRTFGYGEDLSLREDWLYPRSVGQNSGGESGSFWRNLRSDRLLADSTYRATVQPNSVRKATSSLLTFLKRLTRCACHAKRGSLKAPEVTDFGCSWFCRAGPRWCTETRGARQLV